MSIKENPGIIAGGGGETSTPEPTSTPAAAPTITATPEPEAGDKKDDDKPELQLIRA